MQFGILKRLVEQGLQVDAIYGTSVGNLNACGYAHAGLAGLEQFWGKIEKTSNVFKFNWSTLLFLSKGVYNAKPLRSLVQDCTNGKMPTIPCWSCAVEVESGKINYMKADGSAAFVDHVVASASIPGFAEPVNGMVDGGVREQTPLKKAIDDGYDKIVVILCNPWQADPDPDKNGNWVQNILRATDIMSHEIFLNDIQNCLWYNNNPSLGKKLIDLKVYAPEKLVIGSEDFSQDKIQPAIAYGYEQALNGPIDPAKLINP